MKSDKNDSDKRFAFDSLKTRTIEAGLLIAFILMALIAFAIDFRATFKFDFFVISMIVVVGSIIFLMSFLADAFKFNFAGVITAGIVGVIGSIIIVSISIPGVYHILTSKKTIIKLTVDEKYQRTSRGTCSPKVSFKEITAPMFGRVCVSEMVFLNLQPGQIVCVYGFQSALGISGLDKAKFYSCEKVKK